MTDIQDIKLGKMAAIREQIVLQVLRKNQDKLMNYTDLRYECTNLVTELSAAVRDLNYYGLINMGGSLDIDSFFSITQKGLDFLDLHFKGKDEPTANG